MGRKKPAAAVVDGPQCPAELFYLWHWFNDIHGGRTMGGWGPTWATHLDIFAWQQNTGTRLLPWELGAVRRLGMLWVSVMAEAEKDKPKSTKRK
jgi:hypothetical protein